MAKAFLIPQRQAQQTLWLPDRELVAAAPQLSDSEAAKLQLGQSFAAVRQITESCTAIRSTQFHYPGTPPAWFHSLNSKLDESKKLAGQWLDNYSVAVAATIPNSVIGFAPTFDASARALQAIIDRSSGTLSPSDQIAAREILLRMMGKVDEITATVNLYAKIDDGAATGKLIDWQNKMRLVSEAMQTGSASIQAAHKELSNEITKYNLTVKSLQASIEYYDKLVALGAGLVAGGLYVGMIGLGFVFDFPIFGGIVIALGLASVIGGAVTWGVMQGKINKANHEIVDLRSKIDDDNKTLVALDSLNDASRLVLKSSASAVANLSDFAATWMVFGSSLRRTYDALRESSQTPVQILLDLELREAMENWKDAKQYAEGLLAVPKALKELPASAKAA